ncbi:hypothetical protein QW71_02800 [Paenibacillus sp. IHB B 3415]|nr:hypothetical protein QW71_02800 [Paenibacillus sp. IHB B 3415]
MSAIFLTMVALLLTSCTGGGGNSKIEAVSNQLPTPSNFETPPASPQISRTEEPSAGILYVGDLELPVGGATGYASIQLELKESASNASPTIKVIEPGSAFQILKENGAWWLVQHEDASGWLPHNYCFINLPDVIPSIIYDNTNTYNSQFKSSGKSIPGITNQGLYPGKSYNKRLGKEEYIVPVLYAMSKKIYAAQRMALADGNSLKIYEGFRPYTVQKEVATALKALAKSDPTVLKGINTPPWGITWFIVDGVSNHQMGYGMDVSLVLVNSEQQISIGEYSSLQITDYVEYEMPTPIHELSGGSAIFTSAVTSKIPDAWRRATYAKTMTDAALQLQYYCTFADLTPLASEWWHFNDLEARDNLLDQGGDGAFILTENYSIAPFAD